ncbi:unnamed protein product [Bursaphelenchus xylophilus]|uniref:(pine wood nematode) hypothetical protein n=1 Tax=Bursaphelenchus xylophilus TaxID=6326 RepID=A0A1I7S101_BURXY|nr:unnamed protein product [Bursaphelenchus xylophilus]CAG9087949.1 unnamed protein product [Bursaphelenchus xylophilus]
MWSIRNGSRQVFCAMSSHPQQFVVKTAEMRRFVVDCMKAVGASGDNGGKVADLLICADLRGHYSHGLNRLRIYMEDCRSGNCAANAEPKILKQKGATAWVDGQNGLGAVVGHFCTDLAAKLAKEHGIGWVVCKGSNHYGIAGYWPLLLKKEGLIGMSGTNTSPLVFPNRAAQHALGTNPLAVIAGGHGEDDFALDMATSAVALGKIELAERKGEQIPLQWGADKDGKATQDPVDVTQRGGGLLPLGGAEETGGYKGTGLGMMVELFSAILSGSTFGKNVRTWRDVDRIADLGQFFVAIDPECFAPGFSDRLQDFIDQTRGLRPVDPAKKVLIPGDPERINIEKSESVGGVIYGQKQLDHLLDLGKTHKVQPFTYNPVN